MMRMTLRGRRRGKRARRMGMWAGAGNWQIFNVRVCFVDVQRDGFRVPTVGNVSV